MKDASKVLFLTQLAPPVHGASLINGYIKNSSLINQRFDTDFINTITAKDLTDVQRFSLGKTWKIINLCLKVVARCSSNNFKGVFMTISTDGGAFYKSAIIWLIASLFIKKRIVMLHEKGISVTAQKNSFNRFLASQMLSKSSLVVTSNYLLSEFEGYATPKFVVSSGTPGASFSRPDVTTQQFKPRLLFMSNLLVEKGVLVFIEICKELAHRNFDFTAVIVGKEADVSIRQLTALIQKYQLQHRVSVVGPKYDEDRDECLRNADLLIFPTFYKRETTPLVIQEAFKFGVIPIASAEGAIADMIDNEVDGFIIDPGNIACYCDKIITLSQNKPLLNAFREAGRKKFDTRFRLALFEENLTNVLDITLNNKPA